jgi:predicted branched-subunit amino acid permease
MNGERRDSRAAIVRDAVGIGLATGGYGLSFGAVAIAAGLSLPQAAALSLLMFTGASQFAFVGVAGGGLAAASTAVLIGARNALYGLRLSSVLRVRGPVRPLAAQLVIDETTAMAVSQESEATGRFAFWVTGVSVYVCWNVGTIIGGLSADLLSDPKVIGLDAAAPAAFLALLVPRLDHRAARAIALLAAAVALVATPLTPAGVPVLCAAAIAVLVGLR